MIRPRLAVTAALIALAACSSKDSNGIVTPPPPPPSTFLITGADMGASLENVYISIDGVTKTGLSVTVNGTALSDFGDGLYHGFLPAQLATGAPVSLSVTNGTLTATGSAVVPAVPVITNAAATTRANPVTVTWTSTTSPDSFRVSLSYGMLDGSSGSLTARVAGTARQAVLQPSTAPANGVFTSVSIMAFMNGSFGGSYAAGSNMHVRTESAPFTVSIP